LASPAGIAARGCRVALLPEAAALRCRVWRNTRVPSANAGAANGAAQFSERGRVGIPWGGAYQVTEMFQNRTIEAAFPTGIWQQEVVGAEALNEDLRKAIAAIPNKSWHGNIWQSDDNLHQDPLFRKFTELAMAACVDVLRFLRMRFEALALTGCWANMYKESGVGPYHTHPNNYLSGVYYVDAPENCGQLKFIDPRPQASLIAPVPVEPTEFNSHSLFVDPREGKMVVFPAWLPHMVLPNMSGKIRTSIAFNVMFRGSVGSGKAGGSF